MTLTSFTTNIVLLKKYTQYQVGNYTNGGDFLVAVHVLANAKHSVFSRSDVIIMKTNCKNAAVTKDVRPAYERLI